MMYAPNSSPRGFTLLIALILASVIVVVGLALANVAYRQVVLSSTARNSQKAFYNADSALECALYYDQQDAAFNPDSDFNLNSIKCENLNVQITQARVLVGNAYRTTFTVPCAAGGVSATVQVYKQVSGSCSAGAAGNCIFSSGYNTCTATDPTRFERGVKVFY